MTVFSAGPSNMPPIASRATIPYELHPKTAVNVEVLSNALEVQETLATELLQSLGIGQHVDVIV
jgi:hypothetical protein